MVTFRALIRRYIFAEINCNRYSDPGLIPSISSLIKLALNWSVGFVSYRCMYRVMYVFEGQKKKRLENM